MKIEGLGKEFDPDRADIALFHQIVVEVKAGAKCTDLSVECGHHRARKTPNGWEVQTIKDRGKTWDHPASWS
ncbi:MAG: hypothetical protein AAGB32_06260 [Pseudomonadota bacterium]